MSQIKIIMKHLSASIILGFTFFTMAACQVVTKQPDQNTEIDVQVIDLGHGFYELRTNKSGNVLILVGDQGVFMVDTQMEHLVEAIDSARENLSNGQDVRLVLNTHLHRDHIRGNAYYAARGAQIMAHPNVRKFLINSRAIKSLGRVAPEVGDNYLPTINVTSGSSITLNGHTGVLYHEPSAHTDGDIFIHFREANIIHAGDLLFSRRFPFIDIDNGGSVKGYIAGMQSMLKIANSDTVIVAGHGPTSSEKELEASIKMLKQAHVIVEELVHKGHDLASIQGLDPLEEYTDDWDWEFISTDRMVTILYYDLTGKLE